MKARAFGHRTIPLLSVCLLYVRHKSIDTQTQEKSSWGHLMEGRRVTSKDNTLLELELEVNDALR